MRGIKLDVFSPDGFSINREGYYNTLEDAKNGLAEWIKRYESQGYYSCSNGDILMLDELESRCVIMPVEDDDDSTDTPMAEQMEIDWDGEPF